MDLLADGVPERAAAAGRPTGRNRRGWQPSAKAGSAGGCKLASPLVATCLSEPQCCGVRASGLDTRQVSVLCN